MWQPWGIAEWGPKRLATGIMIQPMPSSRFCLISHSIQSLWMEYVKLKFSTEVFSAQGAIHFGSRSPCFSPIAEKIPALENSPHSPRIFCEVPRAEGIN
jgi:hypothetical protein